MAATHEAQVHTEAHFRKLANGKVVYVHDFTSAHHLADVTRPAHLHERTTVAPRDNGRAAIQAAIDSDVAKIREHAERLGISTRVSQATATQHGSERRLHHLNVASEHEAHRILESMKQEHEEAHPQDIDMDEQFARIFGEKVELPKVEKKELEDEFGLLFGTIPGGTGRFGGSPIQKTDHTAEDITRAIAEHNRTTGQNFRIRGEAEEFARHWNANMKCDIAGFMADLFAPFGPGLSASINIGLYSMNIHGSSDKINDLTRDWNFSSKNVHHSYFQLRGSARSSGYGAHFLGRSMDYYIHAGMQTVDVCAALESGGYTWARYGFLPTSDSNWRSQANAVRTRLDDWVANPSKVDEAIAGKRRAGDAAVAQKIEQRRHLLRDPAVVEEFRRLLAEPHRKAQWAAADHPLGALMFPGNGFQGIFDLGNEEQCARWQNYATRGGRA